VTYSNEWFVLEVLTLAWQPDCFKKILKKTYGLATIHKLPAGGINTAELSGSKD
jgi:hypothetical protein